MVRNPSCKAVSLIPSHETPSVVAKQILERYSILKITYHRKACNSTLHRIILLNKREVIHYILSFSSSLECILSCWIACFDPVEKLNVTLTKNFREVKSKSVRCSKSPFLNICWFFPLLFSKSFTPKLIFNLSFKQL